jgi:hypothetical protein
MRKTIITLAFFVAMPAFGQAYRWVDSNGRVQYSDRPPTGTAKAAPLSGGSTASPQKPAVKSESGEASKQPAAPMTTAEKEQAFRKRLMEKEEGEKKQAAATEEQRQKAEHCDQAKRHLVTLESGVRQSRMDLNGERTVLDDSQLAAEKEQVRRTIESACKA